MTARVLIVHATSLLSKGYAAIPPDVQADDGTLTNALFGVTRSLLRGLAFKIPELAVAVLDEAPETGSWPAPLMPQRRRLPALLTALGFSTVTTPSPAELCAGYVEAALADGHDVVIVSGDKRMAQFVCDRVWWYDAYKDVRYTPELVRKRFEVLPDKVAGWLALVGDDDTLPGVKGIGKKGATGLVTQFGSVAQAIDAAEDAEGRAGKALRASLDDAAAALTAAQLSWPKGSALPSALAACPYAEPEPSALNKTYTAHGFFSLLEHSDAHRVETTVCRDADAIRAALATLADAAPAERVVAVAALTDGASPVRGELVGLSLAQAGGKSFYIPLHDAFASNLDGLRAWLSDPKSPKVGHDLKRVMVALKERGIVLAGAIFDSACASHLTEPSGLAPHDLGVVSRSCLRKPVEDNDAILGVGRRRKRWADLSPEDAGRTAGERADLARQLYEHFAPTVAEEGIILPGQLAEYLELTELLVRMEGWGVAVDAEDLKSAGEEFSTIEQELETEIYALAGKTFNLGSTKQLGSVLFEDLGLPIVKRTKTGWSTANEALERIEHAHPIVLLVMRWRRLRRLRDSWVTALVAAISADGRVHSSFHPARSFSGRLVNSQPDLGRVPGRTPEMARIRHAFAAPTGTVLLSVDYEQLGLFVLAHLTDDPALVEPLTRGDDMHTLTAMAVLELPEDAIDKPRRQTGKVVNFATFAGQGASALALQLGVDGQEAKAIVERFDRRYHVARAYQAHQLELAQTRGYITTLAGRRWPIGSLTSRDMQDRSSAERLARRATHEGSVADVSRRGLLRADQALRDAGLAAKVLLQVHDEVLFEVPIDELARTAEVAAEAMRTGFTMRVPLRVSCKAGPNWSELKPMT